MSGNYLTMPLWKEDESWESRPRFRGTKVKNARQAGVTFNLEECLLALMRNTKHYSQSLIEGIGDHIRLGVVEYKLRRELRRPLGEWPEASSGWPQLVKPPCSGSNSVIFDNPIIGTGKNLNKELAHAKRRDLRIWLLC